MMHMGTKNAKNPLCLRNLARDFGHFMVTRVLGLFQMINFCTVDSRSQKMMHMGTKMAKNPYV